MDNCSFKHISHPSMVAEDRRLICPECKEFLDRSDIEGFLTCPFCSHKFDSTDELEDFIIEPQVDTWMQKQPGFTFHVMQMNNDPLELQ